MEIYWDGMDVKNSKAVFDNGLQDGKKDILPMPALSMSVPMFDYFNTKYK